ncbi:hypothetical protein GIB67_025185, partial [Kingdonia uniflora]
LYLLTIWKGLTKFHVLQIVVLKRYVQHGKIMTYEGLCLHLILRTSYIIQQRLSMPFRSQIRVSASSEIKISLDNFLNALTLLYQLVKLGLSKIKGMKTIPVFVFIFDYRDQLRSPLLENSRLEQSAGHFWQEDVICLNWLDQQPDRSVIYIAFGSFTVFDRTQFQELALGLELSGQPFLWVVRPNITNSLSEAYPDGFEERVGTQGKIVGWAPQQKVLAHSFIFCFLSHCGWNSTMEAVNNGISFLCWPYFVDQFMNQSYICDVWRVGLRLIPDESRIVRSEEVKEKVKELLCHEEIKIRISELMEIATKGSIDRDSLKNLDKFVGSIKQ